MASATITFEIEPIVKLYCKNDGCEYNMSDWLKGGMQCCALKIIWIGEGGKCQAYEPRKKAALDAAVNSQT